MANSPVVTLRAYVRIGSKHTDAMKGLRSQWQFVRRNKLRYTSYATLLQYHAHAQGELQRKPRSYLVLLLVLYSQRFPSRHFRTDSKGAP